MGRRRSRERIEAELKKTELGFLKEYAGVIEEDPEREEYEAAIKEIQAALKKIYGRGEENE